MTPGKDLRGPVHDIHVDQRNAHGDGVDRQHRGDACLEQELPVAVPVLLFRSRERQNDPETIQHEVPIEGEPHHVHHDGIRVYRRVPERAGEFHRDQVPTIPNHERAITTDVGSEMLTVPCRECLVQHGNGRVRQHAIQQCIASLREHVRMDVC